MILSQKINGKVKQSEAGDIAFSAYYDVIVAGLGTAGAIAAVTAAAKGLSVLALEKMCCMGGIGTVGGIMGYYFGSTGGYYEELDKMADRYDGIVYTKADRKNGEAKKYVLEQEAMRHGACLIYEATITGVYLDGQTVRGVNFLSPDGAQSAGCKVLIDCTGDAYVCESAGCQSYWGRELDGYTQPFTSVKVYLRDGRMCYTNFDSGTINHSDPFELSKGIIASHAAHLENTYGTEQQLLYLAPLIGIREGRRINGEEMLTLRDYFSGKVCSRPVFYAYADLDKHGWDMALESETLQDWSVASNLGAVNISVPIPLGVMIPKGYNGLLTAGRCMSFDRDVLCCVRMERDMQKAGEAAATAAWLAIHKKCPLTGVPYDELISILRETGCFDENNNQGFRFDCSNHQSYPLVIIDWLTNPVQIRKWLSSDKPGVAIWSARLLGDEVRTALREWIKEEDENLRKHSAFALALLGDADALPVLRQIIKERDDFMLADCRKNNQMRGCMAIYLAGKLRDADITEELLEIVCNSAEFDRPIYHKGNRLAPRYDVANYNNTYFQFLSQSVMALLKIGDTHAGLREKIRTELAAALGDKNYIERITTRSPDSPEYFMAVNIKTVVMDKTKGW